MPADVEHHHEQTRLLGLGAKAQGAFIALAAGDALGWPQEFPRKRLGSLEPWPPSTRLRSWGRRGGGRFYPHEETIKAGEYSDDTQLTLAVARARRYSGMDWYKAFTRTELPLWTCYERGGGGAIKRAAVLWSKGQAPWKSPDQDQARRYFEAGGNGVAMRVIPHAVYHASTADASQLIRDVVMDGMATHAHPRALIGAACYAFAAWWLLRAEQTLRYGELVDRLLEERDTWSALPASSSAKSDWFEVATRHVPEGYERLWSRCAVEMTQLLEQVRKGIAAGAIADDDDLLRGLGCFGRSKGAGTISAAGALYLISRYAAQPAQAVLTAAFVKGADTDTLASMTGGLAGCLAGLEWLPPDWLAVQDREYLGQLADQLAQGPDASLERPAGYRAIAQKEIDQIRGALFAASDAAEIDLDGSRRARVIERIPLKSLSSRTTAERVLIRTSDGQTCYVTRLARARPAPLPRPEPADVSSGTDPSGGPLAGGRATFASLTLTVADLAASARFYEKVIGLARTAQTKSSVSFGQLTLQAPDTSQAPSAAAMQREPCICVYALKISVSDLEAVLRRVDNEQPALRHSISVGIGGGRGIRLADPDGNQVELVEG